MGDRSKTAVLRAEIFITYLPFPLMLPWLPRTHPDQADPTSLLCIELVSVQRVQCKALRQRAESGHRRRVIPASYPVPAILPWEGRSGGGRESMTHTWRELQGALCPRHLPYGALLIGVAHLHTGSKPRMVSDSWPRQPGCPASHCEEATGCMATTCLC